MPVLEEIPWTFRYPFSCDGSCIHTLAIVDWEVYEAYRKWRTETEEPNVLEAKFGRELIEDRDLHLILGTQYRFGNFLIIGLFYPPRQHQLPITF